MAAIASIWDAFSSSAEGVGGEVVDTATSIADALSDAGHEIGAVLKVVAPIVALVPGWGTVVAVALEAAAAWASEDSLADGIVEVVGTALPGPVRPFFDSAADITRAGLEGKNVGEVAIADGRKIAGGVGGAQAQAAYDIGVQVARGEKIGDAPYALARSQIAKQGPVALAAFDAAVSIKNGGNALDATRAAVRAYLETTGSAPALVAFDVGVAIAQGKSLQDAGFSALKNFVAGNTGLERAYQFADRMAQAASSGKSVLRVLEDELATDVGQYGVARAAEVLAPVIDEWNANWNEWGVSALAERLGISELMAQAAQAIMRGGAPDTALYARLTQTGVQQAIERFGARVVASTTTNETYEQTKADIRSDELMTAIRIAPSLLSYAAAKAQAAVPIAARVASPVTQGAPLLPPQPLPDIVQAPAPSSSRPRTGPLGNVALGVTVGLACLALVAWARSS